MEELRGKSWEDLHSLWWVCVRERNVLATEGRERERVEAGYGEAEAVGRELCVRKTQRAIKQVLTERYYSWQEAQQVAQDDPEINLNAVGDQPIYNPMEYTEEEVLEENMAEGAVVAEGEGEGEKRDVSLEPSHGKNERPFTTL